MPGLHRAKQVAGIGLLAMLAAPVTSGATQIDASLNFSRTIAYAGVIFAGTVSSVYVEMHSSPRYPLTRVTFRDLRLVKGKIRGQDSLQITLWGGSDGTYLYVVPGQPEFRVGERCVVMADSDLGAESTSHVPIIGMNRGLFYVFSDSTGRPCVHDWARRPIVRIEKSHLVVLGTGQAHAREWPRTPAQGSERPIEGLARDEDPGSRLSEEEFLAAISSFLKKE